MKIGDYIKQEGTDYTAYALITKQLKNGSFYGIVLEDNRLIAIKASFNGWYPIPVVIGKEEIPVKLLEKITRKVSQG